MNPFVLLLKIKEKYMATKEAEELKRQKEAKQNESFRKLMKQTKPSAEKIHQHITEADLRAEELKRQKEARQNESFRKLMKPSARKKARMLHQRITEADLRASEAKKAWEEANPDEFRQQQKEAEALELPLKEWQIVRFKRQAENKAKELMRQKYYEAQRLNQPQESEDKAKELERLSDKFNKELKEAAELKQQQEVTNSRKTVIEFANELNIPTLQVLTYLTELGISLTGDL